MKKKILLEGCVNRKRRGGGKKKHALKLSKVTDAHYICDLIAFKRAILSLS